MGLEYKTEHFNSNVQFKCKIQNLWTRNMFEFCSLSTTLHSPSRAKDRFPLFKSTFSVVRAAKSCLNLNTVPLKLHNASKRFTLPEDIPSALYSTCSWAVVCKPWTKVDAVKAKWIQIFFFPPPPAPLQIPLPCCCVPYKCDHSACSERDNFLNQYAICCAYSPQKWPEC